MKITLDDGTEVVLATMEDLNRLEGWFTVAQGYPVSYLTLHHTAFSDLAMWEALEQAKTRLAWT